jgi:hypothetical protein
MLKTIRGQDIHLEFQIEVTTLARNVLLGVGCLSEVMLLFRAILNLRWLTCLFKLKNETIRGQDIHLEFQIAEKSNNSEHFKRTHKGTFVVSLMTRNAEVKNVSVKSEAIVDYCILSCQTFQKCFSKRP